MFVIPAGIAGIQTTGCIKLAVHGTGYPPPGEYDDILSGIRFIASYLRCIKFHFLKAGF